MVPETDVIKVIEEPANVVISKQTPNEKKNNIAALKEKISRTSEFLQQLKVLSAGCEELDSSQPEKDKEIFSRRTIQVGAEIQDARDILSSICKDRLPYRQWKLLFDSDDSDDDLQLGVDLDPSVQFFGIDWERVFGRCFSLSMHVNLLESILIEENEDSCIEVDLVRVNKMLKELAAIEADVLSHSEAVLRGRLSKSQRQLIFDEQNKYASLATTTSISKSKSFRDNTKNGRQRPLVKYRKNKTTNLDKLTSSMSAHTITGCNSSTISSEEDDCNDVSVPTVDEQQTNALLDKKSTLLVSMSTSKRKSSNSGGAGNGNGFMQNMTSMFKNIR